MSCRWNYSRPRALRFRTTNPIQRRRRAHGRLPALAWDIQAQINAGAACTDARSSTISSTTRSAPTTRSCSQISLGDRDDRPRDGGGHPALERAVARGGEDLAAQSPRRRPAPLRDRPWALPARVRRLPAYRDERVAGALRRGSVDDPRGARDWGDRRAGAVLRAAAHRDPAPTGAQLPGPSVRGREQRRLGGGRGESASAHGHVRRPAVAEPHAGDRVSFIIYRELGRLQ